MGVLVELLPALAVVLLAAAGMATGMLGAILGTGGAVFLIPLLVLGFGLPMHQAVATGIVTVIATSSAVASVNVSRGTANMRLGMLLEIATTIGAILGASVAGLLAARELEAIFAFVLLPTGWLMWSGRASTVGHVAPANPSGASTEAQAAAEGDASQTGALGGRYFDEARQCEVSYRVRWLPGGLGVSVAAGGLSGLLGLGGGVFKVPALHLICGMPMKAAAATSNFMIGVTAAASAFLYYGRGEVQPGLTALVVIGVLIGSILGTRLERRLRGRLIRRLFAVLLFIVAAQMFFRSIAGG